MRHAGRYIVVNNHRRLVHAVMRSDMKAINIPGQPVSVDDDSLLLPGAAIMLPCRYHELLWVWQRASQGCP